MSGYDDTSFGPWYGDDFDFTLCFEHVALTILPACVLFTTFPVLVYHYTRRPVVISRNWLLHAKLLSAACLLGLEIASLVLWSRQPLQYHSSLAIIASCLSCTAVGCVAGFLDVEHRHSLRPSSFLALYLTLSVLLDAIKARSCLSRNGDLDAIGSLLAAIAGLKGLIVVLEEMPKKANNIHDREWIYGAESTSGFWNRSLFMWLSKTLFFGYRSVLNAKDLKRLDPEFSTMYLSNTFATIWAKTKITPSSHCLMKALLRFLCRPLCAVVFPRLCHTGFLFCQPFLLKRIVAFVDEREPSHDSATGLIGATVFVFLGIAVSKAVYTHASYRLVTMARGILISHILQKTLRLEYVKAGEKSAMSLMSTDIEALTVGLPDIHENWVSFVEVGIGAYLLTGVIGRVSFLVGLPILLSTIIAFTVGKRISPAREAWDEAVRHRVSQTALAFKHLKGIKMLAIESTVSAYIQGLRVGEINKSKPFRLLMLIVPTAATFAYAAAPAIVIGGAIFWSTSEKLAAVTAFPALAIVLLMSEPLTTVMTSYTNFHSALGCIDRIEEYLLSAERKDCRIESSFPAYERFNMGSQASSQAAPMPSGAARSNVIISGHQVSIQSLNGSSLMRDVSFCIRQSTITLIAGPVASGKSVLLRALLGEVQFEGFIHIHPMSNVIAYCDQVPWIRNTSVRQNIVGEQPFNLDWYDTVLDACLLDDDFLRLSDGDETLVGSDGATLSVGQKGRIALARALYSRATVLILDDVFRGLDAPTSAAITDRVFGSRGLARHLRTTIIMTSQSDHHATLADSILVLDGAGNVETRAPPQRVPPNGYAGFSMQRQANMEFLNSDGPEMSQDADGVSAEDRAKQMGAMEAQEDRTLRRRGNTGLYIFYLRSTKAWMLFALLVLLTFTTGTGELPAIYVRLWLEVSPGSNLYYIGSAIISISSIVFCAAFFWFWYYHVIPDSANNLHGMLLKTVMRSTLSFVTETDAGVILNRFIQDMSLVSQELPRAALHSIYTTGVCLVTTAIVLSGARYLAAMFPIILLYIYIIQHFYLRTLRQVRFLDFEAKTPIYAHLSEMATGLYYIRAFGLANKTLDAGLELLDSSQKPFYYMFALQRWLTLSMELAVLGITTTLVAFGVLLPHTTSQTAIGLSLVNMVSLGPLLGSLVQKWTGLETCLGAIARIQSFVKETPLEKEAERVAALPPNWPHSGRILISHMTAVYSSTDVPRPVLQSISLEIRAGQRVVLTGRTGSGKSSLILSILNFLEYSGTIFIDGMDISQVPHHVLRSRITTITQDPVELDGTLRYNLLSFKLARSEGNQTHYDVEIVDVLRRVRLWDYVISQKGGLDASLFDLGFSSGQTQLMNIARAVLHHRFTGSNIILMDEPTSNLDLDTERHIQKEIFGDIFGHCTVLMAAHRLDTIPVKDVSFVVEMSAGMIISVSRY